MPAIILSLLQTLIMNFEYPVDPNIVWSYDRLNQDSPALSYNGNQTLVVWNENDLSLRAARISSDHRILDSLGFEIACPGTRTLPAVAWGNNSWLVVWTQEGNLHATRIDTAGQILDPLPLYLFSSAYHPQIAFDGTNYLVVWADWNNIYAMRLTASGTPIDSIPLTIWNSTTYLKSPAVCYGNQAYLIIWEDAVAGDEPGKIYGIILTPSGTIQSPFLISHTGENFYAPILAFNGDRFFVCYWEKDEYWYGDAYLWGAQVSKTGTLINNAIHISWTSELDYSVENEYLASKPSAIASNGNYWLVFYSSDWYSDPGPNGTSFVVSFINSTGTVLGDTGIGYMPLASFDPSAAFDGNHYLLTWDGSLGIEAFWISPSGVRNDSTQIIKKMVADDQIYSALIFDGNNFFATWWETRERIYGRILSRRPYLTVNLLNKSGMITNHDFWETEGGDAKIMPSSIVKGSDGIMVGWASFYDDFFNHPGNTPYIALFDYLPTCRWSKSISKHPDYFECITLSTNTEDYFVATFKYDTVCALLVDSSGSILKTVKLSDQGGPEIAAIYNGTDYLVVWTNYKTKEIRGARLTSDLTVLDPDGFTIADSGQVANLASDGTDYYLTFTRSVPIYDNVYGVKIFADGTAGSSILPIAHSAFNETSPYIVFDGENYIVAWATEQKVGEEYYSQLWAARIKPEGDLKDSIAISDLSPGYSTISCAPYAPGKVLFLYNRFSDSLEVQRIYGQFVTTGSISEQTTPTSLLPRLENPPSPFSRTLTLSFYLPAFYDHLNFDIYDIAGRLVRSLPQTNLASGNHTLVWDGCDSSGKQTPRGIYFIRFKTSNFQIIKKTIRL